MSLPSWFSAFELCLLSASVFLLKDFINPQKWRRHLVGRILGGMAAIYSAIYLLQFFFEWDVVGQVKISPVLGLCFCFFGLALALLSPRAKKFRFSVVFVKVYTVLIICCCSVISGFFGDSSLFRVGPFAHISNFSAVGLMVLCVCVLLSTRKRNLFHGLTSKEIGGITARKLLPFVLLMPVALGVLTLWSESRNYIDWRGGLAASTVIFIFVLVGIVSYAATQADALIAQRKDLAVALESSQQRMRSMLDHTAVGVWGINQDGNFLFAEGKIMKELGMDASQLVGSSIFSLIGENSQAVDFVERALRGEEVVGEVLFLERWFSTHYQPIKNSQGDVTGVAAVSTDITESKNSAERIRESEARFRTIADAMPQMVWSTMPDGTHDYQNKRWYEFTGADESVKNTENIWHGLFHPEDSVRAWEVWNAALSSGKPYEVEYRLKHRSGEYRWILSRAVPLRNADGKIIRWMGTCTDVQDMKKTSDVLARALQARDDFLSIASHELKTPLTSMKLRAQVVKRELRNLSEANYPREKVEALVDQTDKQIIRLTRLIDDMMDVARIRSGKLSIEKTEFDVCDLVRETIERLRPVFVASGCGEPTVKLCKSLVGLWDKIRIEQVLTNLLTNAIRYGKGSQIGVYLDAKEDGFLLAVTDRGIGIQKEHLEKIFDRFERSTAGGEGYGLGLGLYITKQIVLAHGGKVWVDSNLGRGSTFYVQVPLQHN